MTNNCFCSIHIFSSSEPVCILKITFVTADGTSILLQFSNPSVRSPGVHTSVKWYQQHYVYNIFVRSSFSGLYSTNQKKNVQWRNERTKTRFEINRHSTAKISGVTTSSDSTLPSLNWQTARRQRSVTSLRKTNPLTSCLKNKRVNPRPSSEICRKRFMLLVLSRVEPPTNTANKHPMNLL